MDEALLKRLTDISAVSGYEINLHSLIKEELSDYVDKIEPLKNGSVVAFRKGEPGKYTLMLDAHIDEVGAFVTGITDEGFLRIYSRSIDSKILPGSIVIVNGKRQIKGVIGLKPYHLETKEETKTAVPIEELFVDCGMKKKDMEKVVRIGDTVSFHPKFLKLKNSFVSNKSLDDRVGAYIIIEVLKSLVKTNIPINVIGHFASQEEVTGLGAITSTYQLKPDFAIAIDVTHGTSPSVSRREAAELGKGPVLFIGPTVSKPIIDELIRIAEEYDIGLQKEVGIFTGTDQVEIAMVRSGIPSVVVSIAERYMHTPVEVINTDDVRKTVNLLSLFIANVGDSFMEALHGKH